MDVHAEKFGFYSGNYKKCDLVTMETTTDNKYTCNYVCDVTTTGTRELKIMSRTLTSENPAICDVKVL